MTTTDELISWFNASQEASRERADALRADSREDEAVLELVRGNIYQTFGAMFQIAARRSGGEPAASAELFMSRAEPQGAEWAENLQKAEAHGDAQKAAVERVKLGVFAEVRARLDALGEGLQ